MTIQCIRTTSMEHKALWHLKNGQKVFIKAFGSNFQHKINTIQRGLELERTCLEILKGLAVPDLIKLNSNELPKFREQRKIFFIAQSFAGEKTIHALNLKQYELAGVWVFFVEQLAAFRRHKIIYTDFKCANIMGRKKPFKVMIIDFDHASPLTPGMKKLHCHGFTPGFESPESMRGDIGTEQSLVYECSLVLFHFLTSSDNKSLHHPRRGFQKAIALLHDMNALDLAKVFSKCLEQKPTNRPKNYEDMLTQIKTDKLPPKIKKVWEQLRKPYLKRLAEVGL